MKMEAVNSHIYRSRCRSMWVERSLPSISFVLDPVPMRRFSCFQSWRKYYLPGVMYDIIKAPIEEAWKQRWGVGAICYFLNNQVTYGDFRGGGGASLCQVDATGLKRLDDVVTGICETFRTGNPVSKATSDVRGDCSVWIVSTNEFFQHESMVLTESVAFLFRASVFFF